MIYSAAISSTETATRISVFSLHINNSSVSDRGCNPMVGTAIAERILNIGRDSQIAQLFEGIESKTGIRGGNFSGLGTPDVKPDGFAM